MTYSVRYGTGTGDISGIKSVEEAKELADNGAAYTQCSIVIEDDEGVEVCRRAWCGVRYDPDNLDTQCEDRIDYGDLGYYDDWSN